MPRTFFKLRVNRPSYERDVSFVEFFFWNKSDWPLNDETRELKQNWNRNWIQHTKKASENQTLNSYWIETYFCIVCLRAKKKHWNEHKGTSGEGEETAQSEWVLMSWVWTIHLLSLCGFELTMMIVSREMKRISDSYNQWAVNAQ